MIPVQRPANGPKLAAAPRMRLDQETWDRGVERHAAAEQFRAFLADLGDDPEAWIYCRDEAAQQMVRAEPVRPDGLPPAVALMIYPVDSVDRYVWADFDKVFGLTRAETVVVKRIVSGQSADAIAEELSVALVTIRTLVRRIYTKLGVNNREQLFSKISVFRIR